MLKPNRLTLETRQLKHNIVVDKFFPRCISITLPYGVVSEYCEIIVAIIRTNYYSRGPKQWHCSYSSVGRR